MTVHVVCPHPGCGQGYKLAESQVGRKAVCKRCGREFVPTIAKDTAPDRTTADPPPHEAQGPAAAVPRLAAEPAGLPPRLGRFEIRAQLGAGAFGCVYRAHDPVLRRDVALKMPRASVLTSPAAHARFLREPKAAAQLRHPHIVPIYDAGSEGEQLYIASAFIEGKTLEALLRSERIEPRRAASLTRDLALALYYAHEMGVVHRDVKPSNIMVDGHGEPLLMDFGIAHVQDSEEKLTRDGAVIGTPAYMAPEQADRAFGEVGPASDQYGLGVVLYELLCGQTPFSGPSSVVIFNALHTPPPPPRSVAPAIPADLEVICLKAMSKHPAERYPDCEALAEDLRRWLNDEPILARPLSRGQLAWRWCRRNPALAALSAAAAVLLLAVAAVSSTAYVREADLRQRAERALATAKEAQQKEFLARQEADRQRQNAEKERDAARAAQEKEREALQIAEQQTAEAKRQLAVAEAARRGEQDAVAKAEQARQVAVMESAAANLARKKAEEASAKEAEAQRGVRLSLADDYCDRALKWRETGDYSRALLLNAHALATLPADENGLADVYREQIAWLAQHIHVPLMAIEHPGVVLAVAFSPDGSRLATGGDDHRARLWNAAGGEQDGLTMDHDDRVRAVAFSPDGKILATGSDDASVRLWNAATGESLGPPLSHELPVIAVAFGPDSRTLYVAAGRQVLVWDALSRRRWSKPLMHAATVSALALSPDGKTLVTTLAGLSRGVQVWDPVTAEPRGPVLDPQTPVHAVTFAPTSKAFATVGVQGAKLWDEFLTATVAPGGQAAVKTVAYGPAGTSLLTASADQTVCAWDLGTGQTHGPPIRNVGEVRCLAVHHRSGAIAIGGFGAVSLWRLAGSLSGEARDSEVRLQVEGELASVAFTPDCARCVVGTRTGSAAGVSQVFDCATGAPLGVPMPYHERIQSVAICADGKTTVTVTGNTALIADTQAGNRAGLGLRHKLPILAFALGPTGRNGHTVCADGTIGSWEVPSGRGMPALFPHLAQGDVMTAVAAVGQQQLAVGTSRGTLWLVPAAPQDNDGSPPTKPLAVPAHRGAIRAIAVSPDGTIVLTGGDDRTACLWSVATGEPCCPSREHDAQVVCVAFSPDGSRFLTGASDGSVRHWTAPAGRLIERLASHQGSVRAVAFVSGGGAMFSVGQDKAVRSRRRIASPASSVPVDLNHVVLWAEAATGMEFDKSSSDVKVLDPRAWRDRNTRWLQARESGGATK